MSFDITSGITLSPPRTSIDLNFDCQTAFAIATQTLSCPIRGQPLRLSIKGPLVKCFGANISGVRASPSSLICGTNPAAGGIRKLDIWSTNFKPSKQRDFHRNLGPVSHPFVPGLFLRISPPRQSVSKNERRSSSPVRALWLKDVAPHMFALRTSLSSSWHNSAFQDSSQNDI